jgi:purine-cytosine permease-like protein
LAQRFGTSCAWAVATGVLSGLVIAVVLFVVGYFTVHGLERAMVWTMITMFSACIAAVSGGLLSVEAIDGRQHALRLGEGR